MISRNREALDKRNEMLAMQNVDIESSFASSRLPEEQRTIEKQIKACLLDSLERDSKDLDLTELTRRTNFLLQSPSRLGQAPSENIDSSAQVTEYGQDSVVLLDLKQLHSQFVSQVSEDQLKTPQEEAPNSVRKRQSANTPSLFTFNSRTSRKSDN